MASAENTITMTTPAVSQPAPVVGQSAEVVTTVSEMTGQSTLSVCTDWQHMVGQPMDTSSSAPVQMVDQHQTVPSFASSYLTMPLLTVGQTGPISSTVPQISSMPMSVQTKVGQTEPVHSVTAGQPKQTVIGTVKAGESASSGNQSISTGGSVVDMQEETISLANIGMLQLFLWHFSKILFSNT